MRLAEYGDGRNPLVPHAASVGTANEANYWSALTSNSKTSHILKNILAGKLLFLSRVPMVHLISKTMLEHRQGSLNPE